MTQPAAEQPCRIPLDELTSDVLDQLYAELEAARYDAERLKAREGRYRARTVKAEERAEKAKAAIERVRAIHTHGPRTNTCNDCGQPWPCEVTRALDEQQEQP